jgi:hypothetical protein
MKKMMVLLALAPAIALAAPQPVGRGGAGGGPGFGPGNPEDAARMQKRMRLARTLGLAEALDLDDAAAMRARDVMAKYDEKRMPLHTQMRDAIRVLRDAARGEKPAAGQVDGAIQKLRDARTQLQALNTEMFQQLTQGLSPEKKARAALFLARFHARAGMMHGHGGPGGPGQRGMGGMRGGMGMDESGMQPGGPAPEEMHAMMMGGGAEDADEWMEE